MVECQRNIENRPLLLESFSSILLLFGCKMFFRFPFPDSQVLKLTIDHRGCWALTVKTTERILIS